MHPGSAVNMYSLLGERKASDVGMARGGVTYTAADERGIGHTLKQCPITTHGSHDFFFSTVTVESLHKNTALLTNIQLDSSKARKNVKIM